MNRRMQLVLKRFFDIFVSVAALILLSPLMVLIALAIKLDDRGPVLYVQDRVGKDGRTFRCYKFRTMTDARNGHDATLSDEKHRKLFATYLSLGGLW